MWPLWSQLARLLAFTIYRIREFCSHCRDLGKLSFSSSVCRVTRGRIPFYSQNVLRCQYSQLRDTRLGPSDRPGASNEVILKVHTYLQCIPICKK